MYILILPFTTYKLGYSNFTFELWMILHKRECFGIYSDRSKYLTPINQSFDEHFANLRQFKHEDAFKRCLRKLCLDDVKEAIRRAEIIEHKNEINNMPMVNYKDYAYYRENPALSIHRVVKHIFEECGVI